MLRFIPGYIVLLADVGLFINLISISSSQGFDFHKPCQMMRYQAVFNGGFIPLCDPSGKWRDVQCYHDKCWCVEIENGEEIPNTRGSASPKPDCSYGAGIGALDLDMVPLIASNLANNIKRLDDAFIGRPSYHFNPSPHIYLPTKKYLPPSLWKEFSILTTVKPDSLEGGFMFAIMDKLESVVQFGLSISAGENDYTQYINVWLTEDIQQDENGTKQSGSQKLVSFVVPRMVDRWSRIAISLTQTTADLFLYCQNYTMEEVFHENTIDFLPDSILLIGHAGNGIQQPFKGDILELLITSDPEDAAKQCDESFEAERQKSARQTELEYLFEGSGLMGDLDTELGDETDGSLVASGDDSEDYVYPILSDHNNVDKSQTIRKPGVHTATTKTIKFITGSTTMPSVTDSLLKELKITTEKYESTNLLNAEQMIGVRGEKGYRGETGPPGFPGINGIPGIEGQIGVQGLQGRKGENGDIGQGLPGVKGDKGEKVRGHKGYRGDAGPKGEPGKSIVGAPGKSLLEEIRLLDKSEKFNARSELQEFLQSLPNLTGQKGEPGNCTGKIGTPGKDGLDGIPGRNGLPGLPGPAGPMGREGVNGRTGDKGESGGKGIRGKVGSKGERGFTGPQGDRGLPGPPGKLVNIHGEAVTSVTAGDPGQNGEKGETGDRGEKGGKGERGHKSLKGDMGFKGKTGISGTPGFPGKTGLSGPDGLIGRPGIQGYRGMKGEPGVGLPGPPGAPGEAFRGFPMSNDDSLHKIKGEKGEPGFPGRVDPEQLRKLIPLLVEPGDKGDRGSPGTPSTCKSCVGIKGNKGFDGRRGFSGSNGRPGEKGIIGMPGFPGLDGIPGRDGNPGLTVRGPKGETGSCAHRSSCQGVKGEQGKAGFSGIPGRDGIPGLRGWLGGKGEKGQAGAPGVVKSVDGVYIVPGPPGPPGPSRPSVVGPAGPPGPRGFPGSSGANNQNLGSTLPGGVLLFTTTKEMSQSSLAIPVATLAFVSESQSLYIRVNLGWRMIQLGTIVPLMDSDITNIIPDYSGHGHSPYRRPYLFRPLNSYAFNDQAQESLPESRTQIFKNAIRLYALDEPVTGDLDGISGADTLCYRHAQRSGVEGVFRAVLASRLQKIQSLVFTKFRHLPVVNSKGGVVLKSWNAIEDYRDKFEPLVEIYTFNGTSINVHSSWSEKYFWHGARASGHAMVDEYCQAWTSSSSSEHGVASTFYSGRLLDQSVHSCDSRLALLCIESHKPELETNND